MRTRAFILSYIVFVGILFTALGTLSAFLTNSQIDLLREKTLREYQTLVESLSRDMQIIYQRSDDFSAALNGLMEGYRHHYSRSGIQLALIESSDFSNEIQITIHENEGSHFLTLGGNLPSFFEGRRLYYEVDITETMGELQRIHTYLLLIAAAFSIAAVFILYFLFSYIFKPLKLIAASSRKIADGQYGERIPVPGESELAEVAADFNRMAETIANQIQELALEAELKQQFVDNFAHETRTPLTAIFGYAEYIQKVPLSEAAVIDLVTCIMNEALYMQKLGDSLLELAALRGRRVETTPLYIPDLFASIQQTFYNTLLEKEILLEQNSCDAFLEGQENLVKSLLANLISNGIKACEPAHGKIILKAESLEKTIRISVEDNGCGIPASELSKVTEPFFRLDKARTRKAGGIGLGLALCSQIAKSHGAELTILSEPQKGTCVTVTFSRC